MTDSPRPRQHYEPPNAAALMAEFPGWEVGREPSRMYFAWPPGPRPDPVPRSLPLKDDDLAGLREEIIRWIWHRQQDADVAERVNQLAAAVAADA